MQDPAPFRTRHDGSIDTAHYIARGRAARSRQAHRMARKAGARLGRLTVACGMVLGLVLFAPIFGF